MIFNCLWENEPSLFLLFVNISSKVRQDRFEKLRRFQLEIIANMNHNLKTPLNGISLYLEALLNQNNNYSDRELIIEIQKN